MEQMKKCIYHNLPVRPMKTRIGELIFCSRSCVAGWNSLSIKDKIFCRLGFLKFKLPCGCGGKL